jgi:hypothetical protein
MTASKVESGTSGARCRRGLTPPSSQPSGRTARGNGHSELKIGIFDPAGRRMIGIPVNPELVEVTNEQVLAGVVRAWANQELPSEPDAVDRAASLAAASDADSTSISA